MLQGRAGAERCCRVLAWMLSAIPEALVVHRQRGSRASSPWMLLAILEVFVGHRQRLQLGCPRLLLCGGRDVVLPDPCYSHAGFMSHVGDVLGTCCLTAFSRCVCRRNKNNSKVTEMCSG